MIDKKSYYLQKEEKKDEVVYFDIDKMDGYQVNPKGQKKGEIEVNKIIFVKPEFSEKLIRKKIDKKINELLKLLKEIEEGGDSDEGAIKRGIMESEKLRMQIINNYVKYLGHTYESLTLKKIQVIVDELRYKMFTNIEKREMMNNFFLNSYYEEQREGRRGR